MANLLYVTCNVRPQHKSRSLSLGYEFLEEYLRLNPHDEVHIFDVYRDSIQRVDQDLLNALERIERGKDYFPMSDDERRKMSRVWHLADQFRRCNKYVFVTHCLNLWFPAEFKMYVDAICIPERTYRLTSNEILPRYLKKSLHLHAGPSSLHKNENDLSVPYMTEVLKFLGILDQNRMILDGDDLDRGSKEEYESTRRRLLKMARHF